MAPLRRNLFEKKVPCYHAYDSRNFGYRPWKDSEHSINLHHMFRSTRLTMTCTSWKMKPRIRGGQIAKALEHGGGVPAGKSLRFLKPEDFMHDMLRKFIYHNLSIANCSRISRAWAERPFCQIAPQGNKKIFPPKWFHKDDMEATREVIVNVEPRKTQKGDLAAFLTWSTLSGTAVEI